MHLADAFIQSDLHCIQVTVLHLTSSCFPWELYIMGIIIFRYVNFIIHLNVFFNFHLKDLHWDKKFNFDVIG